MHEPWNTAGGSLGGAGPSVGTQLSVAALVAAGARGGSGRGGGWLLDSPVLAVGCSDGIVRCLQIFPVKVRAMPQQHTQPGRAHPHVC